MGVLGEKPSLDFRRDALFLEEGVELLFFERRSCLGLDFFREEVVVLAGEERVIFDYEILYCRFVVMLCLD